LLLLADRQQSLGMLWVRLSGNSNWQKKKKHRIRTRKIKVKCNSNLFAQLLNAAIAVVVAAVVVAAVVAVAAVAAVCVAVGTRRIVCFVASCCTFL